MVSKDDQYTPKDTDSDISRRSVLAGLTTAGAAISTGSVSAAGDSPTTGDMKRASRAKKKYSPYGAFVSTFAKHGQDLLSLLEEEGVIQDRSPAKLLANRPLTGDELSANEEGRLVTAGVYNGNVRTHLQYDKRLDKGQQISMVVTPEISRSYAILRAKYKSGPESTSVTETIYDGDSSSIIVEPQCTAILFCHVDPEGYTCLVNDCLLKEMKCCDGQCYERFVRTCSDCCGVNWTTCDNIFGGC